MAARQFGFYCGSTRNAPGMIATRACGRAQLRTSGPALAGTQGKRTTVGAANAGVPSPQHEMPWAPSVRAEVEEAAILGERSGSTSKTAGA